MIGKRVDKRVEMTCGPHAGRVGRVMRREKHAEIEAYEVSFGQEMPNIVTVPRHFRPYMPRYGGADAVRLRSA